MSLTKLKFYTPARICLEKTGNSMTTRELLKLKEDLANANDAVFLSWDWQIMQKELENQEQVYVLSSQAKSREIYLQRPDLGRILDTNSQKILDTNKHNFDIVIIISDGLSAYAMKHVMPLYNILYQELKNKYTLAPICLVSQARVALSDDIGFRLKAKLALMLIGERPGLSSFDSLGIYLTYNPRLFATDADRNCISNIHPPDGLSYEDAANKLLYLVNLIFKLKISGVNLKDNSLLGNPLRSKGSLE